MTVADDTTPQKSGEPDRLDSWKEIAAYLGRDVRTVQRWERAEGLPVHRHVHSERGSVFASRVEIDAWQAARRAAPIEPPRNDRFPSQRRLPVLVAGAAAVLGGGLLITMAVLRSMSAPASTRSGPFDPPRLLDALTREGAQLRKVRAGTGWHTLALARGDRELYVASDEQGIFVVDTATFRVTQKLAAHRPIQLLASGDGRYVYAALDNGDVLGIDTQTKALRRFSTGVRIRDLALNGANGTLYVAGLYAGLLAIDTTTGGVRRLTALPCPTGVALAPDTRRLYVSYQCSGPGGRPGHDAVDVLDTSTAASLGSMFGFPNVGGDLAVSPDGTHLWVEGSDACLTLKYDRAGCPAASGVLNVLRTSDRTLIRTLAAGSTLADSGHMIAFTGDGSRVAALATTAFRVFNSGTLVITEMTRQPFDGRMAFSGDGRWMYIAAGDGDEITEVPIAQRAALPAGASGRWTGDGTPNDVHTITHGEVEGRVGYAPGYIGQAFLFGAPGGSVRVDAPGNLGIVNQPFTLSLWINAPRGDAAEATIVADKTSPDGAAGWRVMLTTDRRLSVCFGDGQTSCEPGSPRSVTGGTVLPDGVWRHVALRWNGNTAAVYVGGRLDGETRFDGFVDPDFDPLHFGAGAGGRRPFTGRLDEIEMYHRALTAAEIAARASVRP